jgi:hypothetical protein
MPPEPTNWEDINQMLTRSRASLSPSKFTHEDFRKFKRADARAFKEKQISESAIFIIEGNIGDERCRSGGVSFNNLDHLTDGTLKSGNPNIYYGARPEQLNRNVRDKLKGSNHFFDAARSSYGAQLFRGSQGAGWISRGRQATGVL